MKIKQKDLKDAVMNALNSQPAKEWLEIKKQLWNNRKEISHKVLEELRKEGYVVTIIKQSLRR